jgi:hypothetical protein
VDPKQGSHVVKAVGLSEDHPNYKEQNGCLVEGLVDAKAVVLTLVEIFDALLLVERSVNDPILGHVPRVLERQIQQDVESKRNEAAEEGLEFAHAAALQNETGLFTPAMDFFFKNQAQNQVDESA